MKKIALPILLMLLSWTPLAAQTVDLTGTWLTNWDAIVSSMTTPERLHYDSLPEQSRTRIEDSFTNREFNFNQDGGVEVKWQSGNGQRTETGTWSINDNQLTLTITNQARVYELMLEGTLLTLIMENTPGAVLSRLKLIKQ